MSQKLWISKPSSAVLDNIARADRITILVTKSPGPLSFVLHDESCQESYKVSLGVNHHCDCPTFRKYGEPCVHLCWLLTKKFKVDPQNEIMFQKGLNENYLRSLFNMEKYHGTKKSEKNKLTGHKNTKNKKRMLTRDDECPICFDKFFQSGKGITQCSTCNNHVHIPCRDLWKRNGDCDTKERCPYCRSTFGTGLPIHPSLIPWKKEHCKKSPLSADVAFVVREIITPSFTTECVTGYGLAEKVPNKQPTDRYPDWSSGLRSTFPTSSEPISTRSEDNKALGIAGRGLPQYNSTEHETGPTREPRCTGHHHSIRPVRPVPNVLNKAVSAIRHNQQMGTKGPSAMLGLTETTGITHLTDNGDRKTTFQRAQDHPIKSTLKNTGLAVRTSLSETIQRFPHRNTRR